MTQQILYNCEADCTVLMQCCKSVVLVFISQEERGGGVVVSTLYTIPLDQSEHRILLLFSDIVSAVISNACRTALALANFDIGFHS